MEVLLIYQYTRGGQYAIRAMVYLAALPAGATARQSDVASSTGVPLPYLSKLLAALARAGLVVTRRGPWGGVRIAKPPGSVTLGEVVRAVDGREPLEGCVLGYSVCDEANPCPLHNTWGPIREQIAGQLNRRTLLEIVPFELNRRRRPDPMSEEAQNPSHKGAGPGPR